MIPIDLNPYKSRLRLKKEKGIIYVFDFIRGKWLMLLPEELVRQLLIIYLMEAKGYSKNVIAVERGLKVNNLSKRCDLLIFDSDTRPTMLVECKAPKVKITQDVFRQIAIYNMSFEVDYLLVTNGVQTYCCKMDYEQKSWEFLNDIPEAK
jgi:hypothetical protein